MRWLVTGSHGMLGQDVLAVLAGAGHEVTATDRADLDICDATAVEAAVAGHDVVLNCAAWTAVDDAESHEGDAFRVNAVGPAVLARAAAGHGARLVQVSTDYVLAGDGSAPYPEDSQRDPRSAYGRTKAAGEWAVAAEAPDHLVVRTAWLYGAGGPCFPRTIARIARERGGVDVVDDQVGQPTWTVDVADLILRLVVAGAPSGVYHATSSGQTSWFGFARAVVATAGLDPQVVSPTTSVDFSRPAPRPAYSALGHDRLRAVGVDPIGAWADRWAVAGQRVLGG
ncbi:NAD(P)-dependent oxidoreductase [Actinomycetota bacterium]|nr:NAD(P)-dependent oxidoreductase [Actinomycetota bacterium]